MRSDVAHRALNQNRFDALVSAAYNSARNVDQALSSADAGHDDQVAVHLSSLVYIYQHDAHGHRTGAPIYSHALVNRRRSEIEQYNRPVEQDAGEQR